MNTKKINIIGKKFSKLTVLEECKERDKHNKIMYKCKCDCGKIVIVNGNNLRVGNSKSCGCMNHKPNMHNFKHGKIHTRLYRTYHGMKNRCYNKNNKDYKDYGCRGIKVCNEWLDDFMNFYNWAMENCYRDELTIDRIDVNGNYEPDNCRWITRDEQARNKRNNKNFTYKGETHCLSEWCRILKLNCSTVKNRINIFNWSIDEALELKERSR